LCGVVVVVVSFHRLLVLLNRDKSGKTTVSSRMESGIRWKKIMQISVLPFSKVSRLHSVRAIGPVR